MFGLLALFPIRHTWTSAPLPLMTSDFHRVMVYTKYEPHFGFLAFRWAQRPCSQHDLLHGLHFASLSLRCFWISANLAVMIFFPSVMRPRGCFFFLPNDVYLLSITLPRRLGGPASTIPNQQDRTYLGPHWVNQGCVLQAERSIHSLMQCAWKRYWLPMFFLLDLISQLISQGGCVCWIFLLRVSGCLFGLIYSHFSIPALLQTLLRRAFSSLFHSRASRVEAVCPC